MHELVCYRDYVSGEPVNYWRSTTGFEVDFIIGDHTAIEVKAKKNVSPQDLRSLKALAEESNLKHYLCVSLEPRSRTVDRMVIIPYAEFLNNLWNGHYHA
jgi:predicted AAA+ superfamily ATPase